MSTRMEFCTQKRSRTKPVLKDYIILEAKDTFTRLLFKHFHEKYYHASNETVLNELRQQYWIVGLRLTLRKIVSQCIVCKLLRGKPANLKMGDLPSARTAYRLRLFGYCGLDYFGPLKIKIGCRNEKRLGRTVHMYDHEGCALRNCSFSQFGLSDTGIKTFFFSPWCTNSYVFGQWHQFSGHA